MISIGGKKGVTVPVKQDQETLCQRFGLAPAYVLETAKLGVSRNVIESDLWPLNGMRHPAENGTCGWYLWAGTEFSDDPDFFTPLHAKHLFEHRPEVVAYLGLPPGWRFLIAPKYEDVWQDDSLLKI